MIGVRMTQTNKRIGSLLILIAVHASVLAENKTEQAPLGIKLGIAFDQGFGVTAQFNDQVNAFIGNDGVSADYILRKGEFHSEVPINWYVGVGGAINWGESYNSYSARVPLGISYPFAKGWDVYGQAAPDLKFKNKEDDAHFKFGVDFAVGVRYDF